MIAPVPLQTDEIPTLVFGALARLQYATCRILRFKSGDAVANRKWLGQLEPMLTYGSARHHQRAIVLGLAASGLRALKLRAEDLNTFTPAFVNGMTAPARSRALGDTGPRAPDLWNWGNIKTPADAVLLVFTSQSSKLDATLAALPATPAVDFGPDISLQPRPRGDAKEAFGFRDGLSQPVIPGTPAANKHPPPQPDEIVAAGEFVLGYPDNRGFMPPVPTLASGNDPGGLLPRLPSGAHDLGSNSTFLVVRQLRQNVTGFNCWADAQANRLAQSSDYIKAKLIGRWADGSSLVRNPHHAGKIVDNNFRYGRDDPYGLACPRGAHIRRANVRDALHPDKQDPLSITNRHRILRVGRPYAVPGQEDPAGLLFMCLNAEIERQFEFLQQSWLLHSSFDGLRNEVDPLLGAHGGSGSFTVPTAEGPLCLTGLPDFVTPIGGGYFWLPSRAAVKYLVC